MTPIKRPLAAAGAAALLALSLSACGGAPTDASKADYCKVVNDSGDEAFTKAFEDKDWDKIADLIKEQGDKVEEVGTPDDIPDDAREGFEIQLDAVKGISAKDVEKAFKDQKDPFEEGLSKDEKKKVDAYNDYESKTCSDSSDVPSVPTEVPSTATDLPSSATELPSGLPSDLPTTPEDLASLQSELENLTEGLTPTE